jgi:hypothetical protein
MGGGDAGRSALAGQSQAATPSLARPTARITRRSCVHRRCRLTIVTHAAGRADAARVTATARRLSGCSTGRPACADTKRLKAIRTSRGVFTVTTGRLAPARYRFTVVATTATGLAGAPVSVVLTVGRRS